MPWQSKDLTPIKKSLCVIVVISLILSNNISYAYPNRTLFGTKSHAQRYTDVETVSNLIDIKDNPSAITIPSSYGQIVESYKGAGDTLIVHIQDCHVNETAQLNIAAMLKELNKNYDINLMCLEGASTRVDTSFYDSFPDGEVKEKVSRLFVRKAIFTGAEYFKIVNRDLEVSAFGVEDKNLYIKHLNTYKDIQPDKNRIIAYLKSLQESFNRIKPHIYTDSLKELEEKSIRFKEKITEIGEYSAYLDSLCRSPKIDTGGYANFENFIELTKEQERIDFKKASSEREKLIEELSKKFNEVELKELLNLSIDFKFGKVSAAAFHDYLNDFINKKDYRLNPIDYKELIAYSQYLKIAARINYMALFDEVESVAKETAAGLFQNSRQEAVFKFSESLEVLKDLYNLKLTNKKLDYINSHPEEFDVKEMERVIRNLSGSLGIPEGLSANHTSINSDELKAAGDFYRAATGRDAALIENTLKRLPFSSNKTAILITGGFHTAGVTNMLRQKDISYVVICPNMKIEDNEELYAARMRGILPEYADIMKAALEMLVPAITTGDIFVDTSPARNMFAGAFRALETATNAKASSTGNIKETPGLSDGLEVIFKQLGPSLDAYARRAIGDEETGPVELLSSRVVALLRDAYGITPSNISSAITEFKQLNGRWYAQFKDDKRANIVVLSIPDEKPRVVFVVCDDISKYLAGEENPSAEIDIHEREELYDVLAKAVASSGTISDQRKEGPAKPLSAGEITKLEERCAGGINDSFENRIMQLDTAFKFRDEPFGLIVSANTIRKTDIAELNELADRKNLKGKDKFIIYIDATEEKMDELRGWSLSKKINFRNVSQDKPGGLLDLADYLKVSGHTICVAMIVDEDTARGYESGRLPLGIFVRAQKPVDITIGGTFYKDAVSFKAMLLDVINIFHEYGTKSGFRPEKIVDILPPIDSKEFVDRIERLETAFKQILSSA